MRTKNRIATRVAALAVGVGLLAGGLPVVQQAASASPSSGPCSKIFGTPDKNPAYDDLPGSDKFPNGSPPDEDRRYTYPNPKRAVSGIDLPPGMGQEELLKKYGTDTKGLAEDSPERAYAAWNRNQTGGARPWTGSFRTWLIKQYIGNEVVRQRGDAFHKKVAEDFGIGGSQWQCEQKIPGSKRRGDFVNADRKILIEVKSDGSYKKGQLAEDKKLVEQGWDVRYVFGEEPDEETVAALKAVGIRVHVHQSASLPQFTPSEHTAPKDLELFTPDAGAAPSTGDGVNMIRGSADTAAEARAIQQQLTDAGGESSSAGGVDFSTLELSYVGTSRDGKGLDYSFKAARNPDEDTNPSWGGMAKAHLASDAFFTWLALTPDKFWVNLNPTEPDRIMDSTFAKTDAGRVLLEADLAMKHDFAKTVNPKTKLGARFWDALSLVGGQPCMPVIRNWIVPDTAKIREQDGGIYILDAPLKVNSVPYEGTIPGDQCRKTTAQREHDQRLVDTMIRPVVEKRVNTASEYADLRRVYASRVAAEWVAQRDAAKPGPYHGIIASDDVSRWPLRYDKNWSEQDTYQRYLKSFTEGDYTFERRSGNWLYTYSVGGVDFSKAPKQDIGSAQFTEDEPGMPGTAANSRAQATNYRDSGTTWLGGSTSEASAFGQDLLSSPATATDQGGGALGAISPTAIFFTALAAGLAVMTGTAGWRIRRRRRAVLRRY
ncbi:hypothetical protein OG866_43040 [Streptomyces sp. NBC_00663]|uniref:hypothetical protein n=1 Tax=Streptomyces sp. NBC_00663 TaxID=2975801 RepID=UPI002E2F03C7|nr:hypothetical protein [Streptomyces sp. NBC_00663]